MNQKQSEPEASHPEHTQQAAPPMSTWSLIAIMCSLVIFCPVVTLLAVLFGFKALADVRARPWLRGRGLAWTAIGIGLAVTLLHGGAAYWWHVNVRLPMIHGPVAEIEAGYRGDFERFRAGFGGEAAEASDEEIAAFFHELQARYGRLISISQDHTAAAEGPTEHEEGLSPYIPYVLHFERDIVAAEAEWELFADGLYPRWKSIMISDQAWGDLVFPPGTERHWPRPLNEQRSDDAADVDHDE